MWIPAQIPKKGKIYSVNEGNAKNWDAPTAKYAFLVICMIQLVPFCNSLTIYFIELKVCGEMQVPPRWFITKIFAIHWKVFMMLNLFYNVYRYLNYWFPSYLPLLWQQKYLPCSPDMKAWTVSIMFLYCFHWWLIAFMVYLHALYRNSFVRHACFANWTKDMSLNSWSENLLSALWQILNLSCWM